jgi:hypothetical protein
MRDRRRRKEIVISGIHYLETTTHDFIRDERLARIDRFKNKPGWATTRALFHMTNPPVPQTWHAAMSLHDGTLVHITP